MAEGQTMRVQDLWAGFGSQEILRGIDVSIAANEVLSVIGPTGSGKSTFVRCLNRLHELVAAAWVRGSVGLGGTDIYGARVDPTLLRRQVGMVFDTPNPFPTMSIRDNTLAGLRLTGRLVTSEAERIVEESLTQAGLWEEVRDQLRRPAGGLSGGQQQRLCIARALAVSPGVLLMDDPCAALDPIATGRIEDLIGALKSRCTIVLVTHSMQQAARVSDRTAFFYVGDLIESGPTGELFTSPKDQRTEDYITGRLG